MRLRSALIGSTLALGSLLNSGCERVFFGLVNRGLPPPEATVGFAPELDLSLDVYRPQGNDRGSAPVVLFFYGGGWQRGERDQYRFVGRRLAAHGILAIVADYRTYPRAAFPEFVDDAARAVAWTHRHAPTYGGDPRRLFLAGHSAGAQIAALLGTDPRYLQRHGLQPRELAGVIGLAGPYDFAITGKYRKVFGASTQWTQAQAVNFVDGDEPPFLLVHGDRDRVVEVRDSVELAEKLRRNGVPARLLILPGASHGAPLTGLYAPQRAPAVLPALLAFVRAGA
jgi:acetyl esterase/lipase